MEKESLVVTDNIMMHEHLDEDICDEDLINDLNVINHDEDVTNRKNNANHDANDQINQNEYDICTKDEKCVGCII